MSWRKTRLGWAADWTGSPAVFSGGVIHFNLLKIIKKVAGGQGFSHFASSWSELEVEPIDFQTAVLTLVKECIDNPSPDEPFDPDAKSKPTTLPLGQFFLDYRGVIGRVFSDQKVAYLQEDKNAAVWSAANSIPPVVPLTMHQAVLCLASQLCS